MGGVARAWGWLACMAVVGLTWAPVASATTDEDVETLLECLASQDIGCAQAVVDREGMATASQPGLRGLAARVAFFAGDYPQAHQLLKEAVDDGLQDAEEELRLYANTLFATAGWVERSAGRFRIRYRPGVDAVLVEESVRVLEATDAQVVPRIGAVPPGSTIVELFPDGERFLASSSLTRADVESTGVVALSKWSRLLVASPRAMGRGYPWKDSLSHEYLHLVVAHNSRDRAPVWLQEGIAKALDHRWRGERLTLGPKAESLLAQALRDDALVPFSEMHPSLAKIKVIGPDGRIDKQASAKRAQLAYAQLATLIDFVMEQAGEDVLTRVLPRVGQDEDPFDVLANEARRGSFDDLLADWRRWLVAKRLQDRGVAVAPIALDGAGDASGDPVMTRRRDLWNKLRLGDLLLERGRYRAALVEYEQAADEDDPHSPFRAARMAEAWMGLDDDAKASMLLQASVDDYPDQPQTHRLLAQLAAARGDDRAARAHWETVVSLAPFGMADRAALRQLYADQGNAEAVARQDAALEILRLGGELELPAPLHTIEGSLDVPEGRPSAPQEGSVASRMVGRVAPALRAVGLDGTVWKLSDLRGRVVVLDFWATWCGPCRAVMPALSGIAGQHDESDLVVLGLSDEDRATVRLFQVTEERAGRTYRYPFALDDGSGRSAYGVASIPTMVLIDRKGRIAAYHVGAGDMAAIGAQVAALVRGEDLAPAADDGADGPTTPDGAEIDRLLREAMENRRAEGDEAQ